MIRAERGTLGAGRRRGDEEDVREREKSRFKSIAVSHGVGGSGIDAGYHLSDNRVAPVVVKHSGRLLESSSTRLKASDEHKKGLSVEFSDVHNLQGSMLVSNEDLDAFLADIDASQAVETTRRATKWTSSPPVSTGGLCLQRQWSTTRLPRTRRPTRLCVLRGRCLLHECP